MAAIPRIAELRQRQDLTQRELADGVKVTEAAIASWEHGRTGTVWLERVVRLCNVLDCQVQDLIELQPDNSYKVRIAVLRKQASLSQRELGQRIGGTTTTIANWEKGFSGLDWILQAVRLCYYLKCEVQDLIELSSEEKLSTISDHDMLASLKAKNRPERSGSKLRKP